MWPFGGKELGLISEGYLRENGISKEYQNAFNWKRKKLKSEQKRNEGNLSKAREKKQLTENKMREATLKEAELTSLQNSLRARSDKNSNQRLTMVIQEIDQLRAVNQRDMAEKALLDAEIDNLDKTIELLKVIISGSMKTPEQLSRRPKIVDATEKWEDVKDDTPARNETGDNRADLALIDSLDAEAQEE